jgi:hypothetical protein
MGKTRLAIEICRQLQAEGWSAGFLDYSAFRPDERRWDELLSEEIPLLLVFDYVEHRLDELSWLIQAVAARKRKANARFLLLARDAGDWWRSLLSKRGAGDVLAGTASYEYPLKALPSQQLTCQQSG